MMSFLAVLFSNPWFILSMALYFVAQLGMYRAACVFEVRMQFIHDAIGNSAKREDKGLLPSFNEMLYNPKYYLLWSTNHWIRWVEKQKKGNDD